MNLTSDVHDYLSEEDIRKLCREAIYDSIVQRFTHMTTASIIHTVGYQAVFDAVSAAIGEDAQKQVVDEVTRLLQQEDTIEKMLWKRNITPWSRPSKLFEIMDLALEANRSLIFDLVKKHIREYDFHDIDKVMYEAGKEVLREQIFGED